MRGFLNSLSFLSTSSYALINEEPLIDLENIKKYKASEKEETSNTVNSRISPKNRPTMFSKVS
jgi:hypothetical protein